MRQLWHLGPNISERQLKSIIKQMKLFNDCSLKIIDTWHAKDFGKRIPRKSLLMEGCYKSQVATYLKSN